MVFFLLLLVFGIGLETTGTAQSIGVCYGRVADNLPPANEVIDLFKSNGIKRMRIYDPNEATLQALRGSNIELVIGVPNENIQTIATGVSSASYWVQNYIIKYSKDVKFRYIVVGNEINPNDPTSQFILPAMQNINAVLTSANLQNKIKVSTAIQLDLLGNSYPPSTGAFSSSSNSFISSIVQFLLQSDAPLLANVYTYFSYISNQKEIELSFALFNSPTVEVNDGEYKYTNLFDTTLGALYSALEKVGGANLEVVVSESGWPSEGGVAATVENAQAYYGNLIKHVPNGTPKRPNQELETYLFAMFNENQKGPAETERHFGLFTPNKQPKYQINGAIGGYTSQNSSSSRNKEPNLQISGDTQTYTSQNSSTSRLSNEGIIFSFCLILFFPFFV